MSEELFIPKLGQTVEEVVLINWLVKDGSQVDFGDPVLEVETDKAVFNVDANAKGFVHFGPFQAGDTVPVLTVVATIGKAGEGFLPSKNTMVGDEPEKTQPAKPEAVPASPLGGTASPVPGGEKVFASPRARKLAEARNVDLSLIQASGGGGVRVVEQDVIDYLARVPKASPIAAKLASNVGLALSGVHGTGPLGQITRADVEMVIRERLAASGPVELSFSSAAPLAAHVPVCERQPLRSVRRLIFDRMSASVHETARVTLVTEADATDLVAAREALKKSKSSDWGFTPGYNDLIGLIAARTIKSFPYMNARLSLDGKEIHILQDVNLGVAVDTTRGLVVPVIRQADQMSLEAFGRQFRSLVERAQAGHPAPDDLQGGTFTITNLGSFDVDAFTPVINLPEVAILGVGRIHDKVIALEGKVQVRKLVTLSLVFDHRLVDGAPAARFLQTIKMTIEDAKSVDW